MHITIWTMIHLTFTQMIRNRRNKPLLESICFVTEKWIAFNLSELRIFATPVNIDMFNRKLLISCHSTTLLDSDSVHLSQYHTEPPTTPIYAVHLTQFNDIPIQWTQNALCVRVVIYFSFLILTPLTAGFERKAMFTAKTNNHNK